MLQEDCVTTNYKEYSFTWGKQFGFLTLSTMDTSLEIDQLDLKLNMKRKYLGFINGKNICITIPLRSINEVEIKTLSSLPNMITTVVFALVGKLINPLLYLIIPICIWGSINSNIILHTDSEQKFIIPSFCKKDAKRFVDYIKDVYLT